MNRNSVLHMLAIYYFASPFAPEVWVKLMFPDLTIRESQHCRRSLLVSPSIRYTREKVFHQHGVMHQVTGHNGHKPKGPQTEAATNRNGLWPFRFVAVPVCGLFGLWPFQFLAVLVLSVSVCGRCDQKPCARGSFSNSRHWCISLYARLAATVTVVIWYGLLQVL